MKLSAAAYTRFRIPFAGGEFANAHGALGYREGILLRLTAADGRIGLGEASPYPGLSTIRLSEVEDCLRASSVESLVVGLRCGGQGAPLAEPLACAVSCALDDLRAQEAGTSVAALYARKPAASVPVNATISARDPGRAAREGAAAVGTGFRCVKLKVGLETGADLVDREVARIAAVREALGPGVGLRLDANEAWTPTQAVAVIRAAEQFGLDFVEQPVSRSDLKGMRFVRGRVNVPIAADEASCTVEAAHEVVKQGAADILIIKPMLVGGMAAARSVVELAVAAGLGLVVTTTIDSGVGTALALQLAATLPDPVRPCGLATAPLLVADLIGTGAAGVTNGWMQVPVRPGLGVSLDEKQIVRYCTPWRAVGG